MKDLCKLFAHNNTSEKSHRSWHSQNDNIGLSMSMGIEMSMEKSMGKKHGNEDENEDGHGHELRHRQLAKPIHNQLLLQVDK